MEDNLHQDIKNTLAGVIKQGKVAHTYLFHGPKGAGKAGLARFFARSLLCLAPVAGRACGSCINCRKVEGDNHPDLMALAPQGASFRIEQVRELQRLLQLKPFEGGRRVVIIEGAEILTQAAANSLLKILEEPPRGTIFLLLSDNSHNLPPTVLSRCQAVRVKPLPEGDIAAMLLAGGMEQGKAAVLAALSGGLPEKARALTAGDTEGLGEKACQAWAKIGNGQTLPLLSLAGELEKEKDRVVPFLDILELWVRDLLVWQGTANAGFLFNRDKKEEVSGQAAKYPYSDWTGILEAIEEAKGSLRFHGNTRLVLEALFLKARDMVA